MWTSMQCDNLLTSGDALVSSAIDTDVAEEIEVHTHTHTQSHEPAPSNAESERA